MQQIWIYLSGRPIKVMVCENTAKIIIEKIETMKSKRHTNEEHHGTNTVFTVARRDTSWDDRQLGDIWTSVTINSMTALSYQNEGDVISNLLSSIARSFPRDSVTTEEIAALVVSTIIRSTKIFAKECKFMGVRFSFYTEDKLKLLKHLLFLLLLQRKVRALFK